MSFDKHMGKEHRKVYRGGYLMTKKELIAVVWSKHSKSLSLADTEAIIVATFKQIACALAQGDKVQIPNFGSFEVRERAARNGINPRTGETICLPQHTAPYFKPSKTLKKKVYK